VTAVARLLRGALVPMMASIVGCSPARPAYNRNALPVVRTFSNAASVEYCGEWSDVAFVAQSNQAVVAIVAPLPIASEAAARAPARAPIQTDSARPDSSTSAARGQPTTGDQASSVQRDVAAASRAAPDAGSSTTQRPVTGATSTNVQTGSARQANVQARSDVNAGAGTFSTGSAAARATIDTRVAGSESGAVGASSETHSVAAAASQQVARGEVSSEALIGTAQATAQRGVADVTASRGMATTSTAAGSIDRSVARGSVSVSTVRPELTIDKIVTPERVLPDDTVTYQIRVCNVGPMTVKSGEVRDQLPDELLFVDSSGLRRVDNRDGLLRFRLSGPFPVGAQQVVTVTARVRSSKP
jgi:uncharacterized repeat protein (TIGR01451 family)